MAMSRKRGDAVLVLACVVVIVLCVRSILGAPCPCDSGDAPVCLQDVIDPESEYCGCWDLPGGCASACFNYEDWGWLADCMAGPQLEWAHPGCLCKLDLDNDGMIDLRDAGEMQNQFQTSKSRKVQKSKRRNVQNEVMRGR